MAGIPPPPSVEEVVAKAQDAAARAAAARAKAADARVKAAAATNPSVAAAYSYAAAANVAGVLACVASADAAGSAAAKIHAASSAAPKMDAASSAATADLEALLPSVSVEDATADAVNAIAIAQYARAEAEVAEAYSTIVAAYVDRVLACAASADVAAAGAGGLDVAPVVANEADRVAVEILNEMNRGCSTHFSDIPFMIGLTIGQGKRSNNRKKLVGCRSGDLMKNHHQRKGVLRRKGLLANGKKGRVIGN